MKLYLKNGQKIRVSREEANLIIEKIFNESDKHEYLKLSRDKKPTGLFKLAEIAAIR